MSLFHGSRERSRADFQFVAKFGQQTVTTQSIPASSSQLMTSTGISIALQARQAVLIKRYSALLTESAATSGFLFALNPGLLSLGISIPSPIAWYGGAAFGVLESQLGAHSFGIPLTIGTGDVVTLENEWLEFDDYSPAIAAGLNNLLLFSAWSLLNNDAANTHTGRILETCSAYIYEINPTGGSDRGGMVRGRPAPRRAAVPAQ